MKSKPDPFMQPHILKSTLFKRPSQRGYNLCLKMGINMKANRHHASLRVLI